jgi:hypothetical protein
MNALTWDQVLWATDRPVPVGVLDSSPGVYGIDGPDPCDCDYGPAGHTEADCDLPARCPACHGAGGWQQYDGAIEECPRGCSTR